jgi:hypothetical protein
MTGGFWPVAAEPVARGGTYGGSAPPAPPVVPFDVRATVISQYANSPVLLALVGDFADWLEPSPLFDQFYNLIWNIATAEGYGLDVWGRIVNVSRVLYIPDEEYLAFEESTNGDTFNHGVFYRGMGATSNYVLSDGAYRRLIYAKALSNVWDGSIQGANRILMQLFPGYRNCYVRDDGGMSQTYVFEQSLSPVDYAIVTQSGALPRPAGVTFSVENG